MLVTKAKILILFILLSFSQNTLQTFAEWKYFTAKVINVHDGDTIKVRSLANNKEYNIRLLYIDAPELKQEWGKESRDELKSMVLNQKVVIKWEKQDKYGRTLGEVLIPSEFPYKPDDNALHVNASMVASGNAWIYQEFPYPEELIKYQADAHDNLIGLWSRDLPIYPSDFRKGVRSNALPHPVND